MVRRAQEDADPDVIRRLRKQRADLVDALTRAGAELAADAGHPATPAVLDQVRATVEAATADPHAGAAVRSGLLVRPLESVGFDAVDLDGALADPDAVPDAWGGADAEPIPITSARGPRGAGRTSRRSGARADASHPDPEEQPDPEQQPDPDGQQPDPDEQSDATHEPPSGRGRRRPAARHDPAADRRAAREAEATARAESRDADAALEAAEQDLDAAEDHRADLERRLAEATAAVERAERARDDAEAASDRAREVLRAAQRHRRDVGR